MAGRKLHLIRHAGTAYDTTQMSRDELMLLKLELEVELADIRTQLGNAQMRAREEGIFADEKWYLSAKSARAYKSRQIQYVSMLIGQIGRAERAERHRLNSLQQRTLAEYFVVVAQQRLPEKEFQALRALAVERLEQQLEKHDLKGIDDA